MKITAIKQQIKRAGRLSIFVDEEYAFSLSATALLKSKLVVGQTVNEAQLEELKQLSAADKLTEQAQRYAALRLHSHWEMEKYLQRKGASPALIKQILNKLSNNDLIDDQKFAKAFIADRQHFRPASRRKITLELRSKHVSEDFIKTALHEEGYNDSEALPAIIARKRLQTRYQDDTKLMQYLVRQGFSYADIKAALKDDVT